jgi:hypothetical protein
MMQYKKLPDKDYGIMELLTGGLVYGGQKAYL